MPKVADKVLDQNLSIDGLRFEQNAIRDLGETPGWFKTKLISSQGPMISDFVTHEPSFKYSSYGIHVGQDDRLTFMGGSGKPIYGHFVDCRQGSPTLHTQVSIEFTSSLHRRLIVPRGVAHTFDGLENVVTRDEPVWYSSDQNADWNIDNDLISVDRMTDIDQFPVIRGNEYMLSDDAHQFMSKLSQSLLANPKRYLARYLLTIGGKKQYVMFDFPTWGISEEEDVRRLLDLPPVPGVTIRRSRYALTGSRSWTIVPNTDSCVSDILLLSTAAKNDHHQKALHLRTRVIYTFLSNEGAPLEISVRDCRRDSPTVNMHWCLKTTCDPRFNIVIDPGMAYFIRCSEDILVRSEQEVLVDHNEPRQDLPMIGQDLTFVQDDSPLSIEGIPEMPCPAAVIRLLARSEAAVLSQQSLVS